MVYDFSIIVKKWKLCLHNTIYCLRTDAIINNGGCR
jgi:hypothetical protein